jgi:hypothetical protein
MVKVSVEVRSGAVHFDVAVQAESIQQAVNFVEERYPSSSIKLRFPIEQESFFVEDRTACTGIVGLDPPARVAA